MAANPLEHSTWGTSQPWLRPHRHLVAFLNRSQQLEADLSAVVLESLGTATSAASVQLGSEWSSPLLVVCFTERQSPRLLWLDFGRITHLISSVSGKLLLLLLLLRLVLLVVGLSKSALL